jgi:hypothetical protein
MINQNGSGKEVNITASATVSQLPSDEQPTVNITVTQ